MTITWENYVWDSDRLASQEEIIAVEDKLGVKYPNDYISVVKNAQGKTPNPNVIYFGEMSTSVSVLLTITNDENSSEYQVVNVYNLLCEQGATQLVPFAETGGGDFFCFDFSKHLTSPPIVLWDHEVVDGDKCLVADSFKDFLEMLKD